MANHLEQIEQTLRELLAKNSEEQVVAWVKERVLESYKNGLASAGRKPREAGRKPARSNISNERSVNNAQYHGH